MHLVVLREVFVYFWLTPRTSQGRYNYPTAPQGQDIDIRELRPLVRLSISTLAMILHPQERI